jgi:ribosomal protein S18 acetylase RimI-like enzyme
MLTRFLPAIEHQVQTARNRTGIVRRAVTEDLPRIAAIHRSAFSQFFLTGLGGEFLRRYYGLLLRHPKAIVLISESSGAVEGFVGGFVDPAEFYALMRRNRRMFVLPILAALIRRPSLVMGVFDAVQRIQTQAAEEPPRSCELCSVAVAPEAGGMGLGKALVQAFLEWAWSMDARRVYLTTDADANEHANALYRTTGFQLNRRFRQGKGRWMNEYILRRSGPAGNSGMCP